MPSKSEITTEFIIKTVSPVFNRKGYSGTSISDITTATGLTKGAIYGNFVDKNELAVRAFVYNVNLISSRIEKVISTGKTSLDKLYAISDFYKDYYQFTYEFGGCPILNVGIDSNHQNPALLEKVKKAIRNLQRNLAEIIQNGINAGEIRNGIDAGMYARRIFSMVEGGIFMSTILKDRTYMEDLNSAINNLIEQELKQ
jgi:AcrR family transcriptional regulator